MDALNLVPEVTARMVNPVPEDPFHVHFVLRFKTKDERDFGGDVFQINVPRRAYDGRSSDVTVEGFYDDLLKEVMEFLHDGKHYVHLRRLNDLGWYAIGDVDPAKHAELKAGIIAAAQQAAELPRYKSGGGRTTPKQGTRM